jgi:hypothetical protein
MKTRKSEMTATTRRIATESRAGIARLLSSKVIVLGAAITLSGFSAMAASRNGLNSFDFGNSYAGAKGSYSITAENRSGYSKTALNANGTVKFRTKSVKGVDFTATVENSSGRKSANYNLQAAMSFGVGHFKFFVLARRAARTAFEP